MAQPANFMDSSAHLSCLHEMRRYGGAAVTRGLSDDTVRDFLARDSSLAVAIRQAHDTFDSLRRSRPEFLALEEQAQIEAAQHGIVNFYATDAVNPYVAAGAKGPWVVTLKGAVVYDCGGYGMLGFGHAPDEVLAAMNQPHVMANVMSPSASQLDFIERLGEEIGHSRKSGNPFSRYVCLNSGSEAVTLASRLADVNSKIMTGPGGRHAGQAVRGLTLRGSFHGRTDKPARFSDSTIRAYRKYLRSFEDETYLLTVTPNDVAELEEIFQQADAEGFYIEAFFMEPVMGEGNPGQAISPEFYQRARQLCTAHGTLLMIDSIQAGLRAHGVLSIVDYPGFRDLPAPDMETYSKALNAGQYPLSVVAMTADTAALYRTGIYGNTMTSNPRALDVAVAVLDKLSPEVRENIRERGAELLRKFRAMADELDGRVTKVQGTGLLLSCELAENYKVYGAGSTEEYLRRNGLGVIHGGSHSLRYTPYFLMSSDEVDLVVELTRDALLRGPVAT